LNTNSAWPPYPAQVIMKHSLIIYIARGDQLPDREHPQSG
jgi:hypothetical protein